MKNTTNNTLTKAVDLFISAEINKPRKLIYKKDLRPINNLKIIFRDVRDYFAGNVTGITRDEKIAQNIMRLLFCKIFDEKSKHQNELIDFSNRPNEDTNEFAKRIRDLFDRVKAKYNDIFEQDEEIEILPTDLSFIVSKLEDFYLLDANRDIIADAFEELIGTAFRGGEGQFFTPRNVVQMMIDVMQPQSGDKIIDPACGSGGFLAHILQHLLLNNINNHYIAGIDKDLFLSRLAKIYLTLLGESEYHIFCENSLENPKVWSKESKEFIKLGTFDLILTNPPFGAKIPVIGADLLKQYELAHYWNNQKGHWTITNNLRDKQPPQILFIERIIQLLKDGGRAGIVLPEGIYGNPSDRYIWQYIRQYASIIGVVSLSQETFQPSTHTKTSVVFLEKKKQSRNSVFFAIAKTIGHNKNGKETYKMNGGGVYLIDKNGNKILDDETPDIAKSFTQYLKGKMEEENHLGFIIPTEEIKDNIYIPESYKPEIKEKLNFLPLCISQPLAVSTAAWLGMAPLSAYFFYKVSFIALLSNLVIVPLISVILVLGIISIGFSAIYLSFAGLFVLLNQIFINFLIQITKVFTSLPFAAIYLAQPKIYQIIYYYLFIFNSLIYSYFRYLYIF